MIQRVTCRCDHDRGIHNAGSEGRCAGENGVCVMAEDPPGAIHVKEVILIPCNCLHFVPSDFNLYRLAVPA
jgi:hypothetical protein